LSTPHKLLVKIKKESEKHAETRNTWRRKIEWSQKTICKQKSTTLCNKPLFLGVRKSRQLKKRRNKWNTGGY
jgi:hypothetical protein